MLETCRICSASERCWSSSRSIVSCGNRWSSPLAGMKVVPSLCPGTGGGELIPMAPGLARTRSDDMNIDLTGRSAIVTGGSKGIGLAVATRFAASGADVAIVARGRAGLDEAAMTIGATARGKVVALQGDVAVAADIGRIYEQVMQAFRKVDIVVNNAGESRTGAFEGITDEMWREDFDQKLFAAIRLTRLAWPQMKERRWGRVINTLNIGAKAPRAGSAPTTISRAAGLALTKVLAGEGAPYNVLVNALLVGFIEADQHVRAAEKAGPGGGVRQHCLFPRIR